MKRIITVVAILFVCGARVLAVTSPDAIGNLALWLKADAGVTTNSAGQVTAWTDQSGNSRDAAASAAAEPDLILSEPGLNGMPTLRFDGSSQYMTVADRIITNGIEEFTIIAMAKADINDNPSIVAIRTGLGSPLVQLDQDATGHSRFIVRNSAGVTANAVGQVHTGTYGMYAGVLTNQGSTNWINRLYFSKSFQADAAVSKDFRPNTYLTSGDQYIGKVSTRFWEGDIAEIIIYERALSENELEEIQCYLASRYKVNHLGPPEEAVDEVPGLALWLRADSGVFEDPYANDPAENFEPVVLWADSSGNTHDAVGLATPRIAENFVNGLPVIGFSNDSEADRLYLRDDPISTDPDQLVLFAVFRQQDGDVSQDMIFTHRNSSQELIQASVDHGVDAVLQLRGSGNVLRTITAPGVHTNGAFNIAMYQFDVVNDYHAIAVNGGAEVVDNYNFGNQTFVADTQRIGYYTTTGGGGGLFFSGHIAEMIVYEGVALSRTQKNRIGYYLEQKYGLDTGYSPAGTIIMIQ